MKKVINSINQLDVIQIDALDGRSIVAYLSKKTGTPKILIKLQSRYSAGAQLYGFTSIAYATGDPVFTGLSVQQSASCAINSGREVFQFESYDEFISWIPKNSKR